MRSPKSKYNKRELKELCEKVSHCEKVSIRLSGIAKLVESIQLLIEHKM